MGRSCFQRLVMRTNAEHSEPPSRLFDATYRATVAKILWAGVDSDRLSGRVGL